MKLNALSVHPTLQSHSRLPTLSGEDQRTRVAEFSVLMLMGIGAALMSAYAKFGIGIPGHAIIRTVFPMALGLALAPRRMAGGVMSASALATAMSLSVGGFARFGVGATTSLCLMGPLLDLSLWRARRGWRLYVGFAVAGLGCNLAAMAVRGGTKLVGLDHPAGKPLGLWWPLAVVTYAGCGLIAGLLSAFIWFRLAGRPANSEMAERPS